MSEQLANVALEEARSRQTPVSIPELACEENILGRFGADVHAAGLTGEGRNAGLLYLAFTSRVLEQPVSIAIKGVSSGGKSYTVKVVSSFFPQSAYYALSAMSEKALVYSTEPLRNRMLVLYEAEALNSDFGSYLLRTLLSEGHLRYETVDKRTLKPMFIEKEGPTGLIVTTTRVSLHPENETRLLSLTTDDSRSHTAQVLHGLAAESTVGPDLRPWRDLQSWLESGEHRVTIPFAELLADQIAPVAVRLRRDFGLLLNLVRAHAVLHRHARPTEPDGRIIATTADYEAVHALVADLMAEGIGATVPDTVRETVAAVEKLKTTPERRITYSALGQALNIDQSAARRRALKALHDGYLDNRETRERQPADLVPGEPMPEEVALLPEPSTITRAWESKALAYAEQELAGEHAS